MTEESAEEKLRQVKKYVGDLCYKAPEVFPSGQVVHYRVGVILGMWPDNEQEDDE